LRLGLEEVRVESFATEEKAGEKKGTVRGMAVTAAGQQGGWGWTAPRQNTCDAAVYTCPECPSPPYTDLGCPGQQHLPVIERFGSAG
jgi:hypothetical protein